MLFIQYLHLPNIQLLAVSPLNTTNHCNKEERFSEFGDIIHTVCSFVFPHELTPRPNTETGIISKMININTHHNGTVVWYS